MTDAHAVGLRDLRHHTSEVLARVRHGETIDVTDDLVTFEVKPVIKSAEAAARSRTASS
jgi:hypothetical protein